MSPQYTNNKSGGSFGRAASGTACRCDAARADSLRALARGLVFMACAVTILVLNAADLWPHLFLR